MDNTIKEIEDLRRENSLLQRRISCQRHDLARKQSEVIALSSLVSRYAKDYWDLFKKVEAEEKQRAKPLKK